MRRVLLLPCCALAAAAAAAPAPRPRPVVPWVTGWGRPVDPKGDCKFVREGGRLTITVPGEGHGYEWVGGRLNSPRLLRDAEDFAVQVRVGGGFGTGRRAAGILLVGGKEFVRLVRAAVPVNTRADEPAHMHCVGFSATPAPGGFVLGPALDRPAYLRLERRGDRLRASYGTDGKVWTDFEPLVWGLGAVRWFDPLEVKLPGKVKVGVIAESTAPGAFTAVFEDFKLTPLRARTP